jgi:hypothetical protein
MTRDDDGTGCDGLNDAGTLVPAAAHEDDTVKGVGTAVPTTAHEDDAVGTKLTLESLVANLGGARCVSCFFLSSSVKRAT